MVLNYQQKRNSDFILKSCQIYFCFKLCYEHYKTRVSRHSGCWINDIKYCRTSIFLHIICLSYIHLSPEMLADEIQCTLRISINNCHFHITSNLTELSMFWWLFSKEDTFNNNKLTITNIWTGWPLQSQAKHGQFRQI